MGYFEDTIDYLNAQIAQLEKENSKFRGYINKFGVLEKLQDSDSLGRENESLKLENESLKCDNAFLRKIKTLQLKKL